MQDPCLPPLEARPCRGLEATLRAAVDGRRARGLLRGLSIRAPGQVDFSSNDYLGFAASPQLASDIDAELAEYRRTRVRCGDCGLGSTGSRLLSGNSSYYEETEQMLAEFHRSESALLFNSGFDLNLGLYGYMPQVGDVVVFDELVHSSIHEGLRLSRANKVPFRHNDVGDLRRKLAGIVGEQSSNKETSSAPGLQPNIIIAVESVYSMDGDCAPLLEFCDAADEVGASVIVDEAHGTGVFGADGRGWAAELGVEHRVFCRVHTFGKALGVHGAVVVGPHVLRDYLINYARPLIYSTSLPAHSLASIRCAYALLRRTSAERQRWLRELLATFHERLARLPPGCALASPSPIQAIVVPGNAECVAAAQMLQRRGFAVLPIRSPTVPAGTERLRIILHYHNTREEVNVLMDAIEEALYMPPCRDGEVTSRL
mmetsp:Transcript_9018/g.25142  ORF Transcript_9018/g.25142 Transcript_9018/m.25142 type:complete len:429 (-) Transcript_9018:77-1363(-)